MVGRQVLHEHERDARVRVDRHRVEEGFEGRQAAGRGADADNRHLGGAVVVDAARRRARVVRRLVARFLDRTGAHRGLGIVTLIVSSQRTRIPRPRVGRLCDPAQHCGGIRGHHRVMIDIQHFTRRLLELEQSALARTGRAMDAAGLGPEAVRDTGDASHATAPASEQFAEAELSAGTLSEIAQPSAASMPAPSAPASWTARRSKPRASRRCRGPPCAWPTRKRLKRPPPTPCRRRSAWRATRSSRAPRAADTSCRPASRPRRRRTPAGS